jgi:hypothetical protein
MMDVYEYKHIEVDNNDADNGYDRLHNHLLHDGLEWDMYATHVLNLSGRLYSVIYILRRVVNVR